MFALTDLAFEVFAAWLVASGVAWIAIAAYRVRSDGVDSTVAFLAVAAFAGWAGVLRLTTGVLGGEELIPLDIVHLVWNGLPYYLVFGGVALGAAVALAAARRSAPLLAGILITFVGLPLIAIPLVVGDLPSTPLFSDRFDSGVGIAPPESPVMHVSGRDMVFVPAGPFVMGSLDPAQLQPIVANREGDEQPVRTVSLDGFYIDRLEVTNREFARFVMETGYVTDAERGGTGEVVGDDGWYSQTGADWRHPMGPEDSIQGLERHPVVQVSWNDAKAFCEWSGKRLPREAEWEKAARGIDARAYPWGHEFDPKRLNYCPTCDYGSVEFDPGVDGYARTAPVGSFPAGASPYGALDMAGNVWEWVEDWYDPDYYAYGPTRNPAGPVYRRAFAGSKSIRGGSWTSAPGKVRTSSRSYDPADWRAFGAGIRCAADA